MSDTKTAVPVLKHFAVWYGPQWDNIFDCRIESRDPAFYEMDPWADYFRFYDRLELDWELNGEIIKLRSEQFNFSPFYIPGGQELTEEERDAAFGEQGTWRAWASQRDQHMLVRTRHRASVLLPYGEVELLPAASSQETHG